MTNSAVPPASSSSVWVTSASSDMNAFVKQSLTRQLPAFAVLWLGLAAVSVNGAEPAGRAALSTLAAAPLYFEANDAARFIARGQDCSVLVAPDSATLVLSKSGGDTAPAS